MSEARWARLERDVTSCERCPRLRAHSLAVARVKRKAYRDERYWGLPVPGFGDRDARILVVGLAPAAHGANRTGRMFTGDSSGEWLYGALQRAGLSSHGSSHSRTDELRLNGVFINAVCRCAPPDNRPDPVEMERCAGFLDREIDLLSGLLVVVALGKIAWDAMLRRAERVAPGSLSRPRPKFGHGATTSIVLRESGTLLPLLGSYHPSRQNTQTGRLTRPMLDRVFRRVRRAAGRTGS